jgi:DNA primase
MKKQNFNAEFIKSAIYPSDFYRHNLHNAPLNNPDWNEGGLCPFHADRKPGSFYVNLSTGAYKCFSCGAKGGDIIAFTKAVHGLSFPDALTKLARDWGLI